MTLLSRGISSSGQGLSYFDKAIEKMELRDKQLEQQSDNYNSLLDGVKASGTYFGGRSRNILNEYGRAFEEMLDIYSADPSKENEQKLEQVRLATTDFYNRAVAARQNSLTQLNGVKSNPENFSVSLDDALREFSSVEDASVNARFDINSMQMYVDGGEGEQMIGELGYYNGENPLFYSKSAQLGAIKAEGAWAMDNLETFYNLIDPSITDDEKNIGKQKVIEAFMETARPKSSAYQETAIYNYLQDVKGVDLTKIESETELVERIIEVRNNGAELTAALEHMAGLEYDYMVGAKSAKEQAKVSALFNEVFRGDTESRAPRPAEPPYAYTTTGETGAATRYSDEYAGVEGVRMLNKPMGAGTEEGDIAGLDHYAGELGQLLGYDVDALGRIVALVHKVEVDPDDQEKKIITPEFIVLDGNAEDPRMNDLYNNLRGKIRKDGMFSFLQGQSILRMSQHENEMNRRRIAEAYANSENVETPREFQITVTPEDVRAATGPSLNQRRVEQREEEIEDIQDQFNFTGNNAVIVSPTTGRRGLNVSGINKKFVQRLVDEGYSNQEIRDGIKYMQQNDITVEVSPLRSFLQRPFGFDIGLGGDDMGRAVNQFREALRQSSPVYEEKYMTGPKPFTEADAAKLTSGELWGGDTTGSGAGSAVIDNIFREEGYSADGTLVNVPPTGKSGVTIGGLDLGAEAGNIDQKLEILEKYIPEEQMEALKPLTKLTGPQAQAALQDSLDTGRLNPDTWGFTNDTLRQIQAEFVSSNTIPSIAREMGVSVKEVEELPEDILVAITSIQFMTPGPNTLKAVGKAMKSGSKEDWLAVADMYENYYGSEAEVRAKLRDKRIAQGNVNRVKAAAKLIRSVYS
jgi:hypothetical protein